MPLVEIIVGKDTSDDTLSRALAFSREIKKTAIVVNDGYGFYTTRVFSAYIMEAAQLVAQGHDPALVEYAARRAGMVVSPLKVFDEVTLTLAMHAIGTRDKADLYLVTAPDVPFVQDGFRDGEHIREWMDRRFTEQLANGATPVVRLEGAYEARFDAAVEAVERLLAMVPAK